MNNLSTYSHKKFIKTITEGRVKLIAELSDLGPNPLRRVWPDACDVGFNVEGKTGAVVTYVVGETITDSEGEVLAYRLMPTLESRRKVPACAGTTVTLLND